MDVLSLCPMDVLCLSYGFLVPARNSPTPIGRVCIWIGHMIIEHMVIGQLLLSQIIFRDRWRLTQEPWMAGWQLWWTPRNARICFKRPNYFPGLSHVPVLENKNKGISPGLTL